MRTTARDAARSAANARSAPAAQANGDAAARAALTSGGITCRTLAVDIDTTDFRAGGVVTARISCAVDLGDLTGLRLPATRTITSSFTAPVDQYRGVS